MSYYNITLDLPWKHQIIALGNSAMGDLAVLTARDEALSINGTHPFGVHSVDVTADRSKPMPVSAGGYYKTRSAAIRAFNKRLTRGLG